ncbi:MAG: hypothetical protein LC747_06045 [Acidobacteria bacterium]|nr:hypothetical protein [Acidobacteriota bacterium]
MERIVECVPNFSEGRRPEVIEQLVLMRVRRACMRRRARASSARVRSLSLTTSTLIQRTSQSRGASRGRCAGATAACVS